MITASSVARSCATGKRRGETDAGVVRRATHLHLGSRNLTDARLEASADTLAACASASTAYLQDNALTTLAGLAPLAGRLRHVVADRNRLVSLEGLGPRVVRLSVDDNLLPGLDGLGACRALEELSARNQGGAAEGQAAGFRLGPGLEGLVSLKRLSLAGCRLRRVAPLAALQALEELDVSRTLVDDLDDLLGTLRALPRLRELSVRGCPVAKGQRFRDAVVVAARSLRVLDGAEVSEKQRLFITRLHARRVGES